jgi:hypothetical protein
MASPLNAPSAKFVNGNSNIRKELLDITNRIHAAQNIKHLMPIP